MYSFNRFGELQVLQVLSQVENDAITTAFLHEQCLGSAASIDLLLVVEVDVEEFAKLVKQPNMVILGRLGLDEFVTQIQAFRRTNQVTIKDLLQFRLMVRKDTEEVLRAQNKTLQKSVRRANKFNRLK
ncbi:EF-hand domain-containing protein [Durusdinium trenchii]|uniref:EF-hand domain-containing protein n=1 Tax=Durusdinium trenchii TaxID=1381693 RepID=A0ABP0IP66_9DINO